MTPLASAFHYTECGPGLGVLVAAVYYTYIMANSHHTVLYTGMTNDLRRRVGEHRQRNHQSFTRRYNVTKLVYFEILGDPLAAIKREKQIKAGSPLSKIGLIENNNSRWADLTAQIPLYEGDCFARLGLARNDVR